MLTEKEFNNLCTRGRNNTVRWDKDNKIYYIEDKNSRILVDDTYKDAVIISMNNKLTTVIKEAFLRDFSRVKSYCEEHNCRFYVNGVSTCDGLGC